MMRRTKRLDRRRMGAALRLAALNDGLTGINPSVGCIITNQFDDVIGEGVTGIGGRPHAEEIALESCRQDPSGGTAYVTLEPCRARSNPEQVSCSNLLIQAGIQRVVCAISDPHPTAKGGLNKLSQAGIAVVLGVKKSEAKQLYARFFRGVAKNNK